MERIYLDHAATTNLDSRVLETMLPYLGEVYGNPSSIHAFGRDAKKAIEEARANIAKELGASLPAEIIFTGSGSESDNLAIKGVAFAYREKGNHIITSAIEHHAVYDTCAALEKEGFEITYLPVDEAGMVSVESLVNALTPRTILVSIMHANNEVGTVQPLEKFAEILKERKILFHTDAVQTVGMIPVKVDELGVDLLTLTAHKFYGPKGVGALYVRKGVKLIPQIHGGAQERNRRAGTENVSGIVGMAKALQLANEERLVHQVHLTQLRDYLIESINAKIPQIRLNGHPTKRLPGNVNFCFRYIEGEALLLNLDLKGIAASSGSACTSGSLEPSHVLLAMGLTHEIAHGSLRLSLGRATTKVQLDYVIEVLPEIVSKLRAMSPLYEVERGEQLTCTVRR